MVMRGLMFKNLNATLVIGTNYVDDSYPRSFHLASICSPHQKKVRNSGTDDAISRVLLIYFANKEASQAAASGPKPLIAVIRFLPSRCV